MEHKLIWSISKLKEWKDNPRSIKKKDFERLKRQIEKLGQYKPLLITPDGLVIGGNMRLKAYRELGIKEIWVSVVEPKDKNEMMEYALSDNDRAGFYDADLLANISPEFDINWEDYAVDLKPPITLEDLIEPSIEEDEIPELSQEPPDSVRGEIYKLDRHRLMCGDSTKKKDVEKLMDGKRADMVFTDPPYNIDFDYENYEDSKSPEEYLEFCKKWFNILWDISIGTIAITCGIWNAGVWDSVRKPKWVIAWIKMNGMSRTPLLGMNKWEPVLLWRPKRDRDIDVIEATTDRIKGLHEEHPSPKPLRLIATLLRRFSNKNNKVLDVFGGSGSTLIACEQTNRICYMMEIDPRYCDVIRKRYNNYIENNKKQ